MPKKKNGVPIKLATYGLEGIWKRKFPDVEIVKLCAVSQVLGYCYCMGVRSRKLYFRICDTLNTNVIQEDSGPVLRGEGG